MNNPQMLDFRCRLGKPTVQIIPGIFDSTKYQAVLVPNGDFISRPKDTAEEAMDDLYSILEHFHILEPTDGTTNP